MLRTLHKYCVCIVILLLIWFIFINMFILKRIHISLKLYSQSCYYLLLNMILMLYLAKLRSFKTNNELKYELKLEVYRMV